MDLGTKRAQQIRCLPYTQLTWILSLAPHRVHWALPGMIFKCRARSEPWGPPGVVPNKKNMQLFMSTFFPFSISHYPFFLIVLFYYTTFLINIFTFLLCFWSFGTMSWLKINYTLGFLMMSLGFCSFKLFWSYAANQVQTQKKWVLTDSTLVKSSGWHWWHVAVSIRFDQGQLPDHTPDHLLLAFRKNITHWVRHWGQENQRSQAPAHE